MSVYGVKLVTLHPEKGQAAFEPVIRPHQTEKSWKETKITPFR